MGYYTRVLSCRQDYPAISALAAQLQDDFPGTEFYADPGHDSTWTEAVLANAAGDEIAEVERSPVVPGTLGSAEIAEFLEGLADSLPTAAARWLESYLPNVRNVFSFQHLFGSRTELGSETLGCLRGLLWARGRAIFQADGEGFSNEDGYHILWDFSDDVQGEWNMAVLEGAVWIPFRMDLGSKVHREAFLAGRVPQGASLL